MSTQILPPAAPGSPALTSLLTTSRRSRSRCQLLCVKGIADAGWEKSADFCHYSYLRATIGSTRIARRAGRYPAKVPAANNAPTTHARVSGSFGETPYSM